MIALYPDAINLVEIPLKPKPMHSRDWGIVDWFAFIERPTHERITSAENGPWDATVENNIL
jgi:hypothetical protein